MFGVTFMVLAPESDLVAELTTPEQKAEVEKYLDYVKKRTERDRQMDHKVGRPGRSGRAFCPPDCSGSRRRCSGVPRIRFPEAFFR